MTIPKTSAVIGSGTMGPGIAALLARYGSTVRLNDISEEALTRAETACSGASAVLDQLQIPTVPGGSVSYELDLTAALDGADFVIEAVPETIELKKSVLAQIEAAVATDVVIATNTSGIPITDMAASMAHPERFIGMHWSNPPHLIPMIEVIRGDQTSTEVETALVEIVRAFGYEAVVEKEIPGFIENRVLYAIMRECLSLLEQGVATQEDLDTCVKWGIGYKLAVIGPMRLLDMAGLDIYTSVSSYLNPDLSKESGISPLVRELTEQNRLGMKTEDGMYPYGEGDVAAKRADILRGLVTVRKALSEIKPV
ncbi:3-hydroxybutyryl-CoA dehydrogenase/5-formyl-3-hydroxy-2-methylpyridine 4-carboxylate dehydrogenase [Spinactinospora alkalitolerans]|uniref:3-hydroxybutyryl-CoA dehydrogenase/5-formyl-3-hydroxy-2-methylpyridine 4-carboxylate dehydrogenase n=1 Tax=Spinactinospora alkalitolerans TaxID=687207 RepID=A0A852TN98_9ACTN|nr:3-hydroxyacyl-CoA dehydrogenase NAD-binding domain-containing protein [Spinactinospora alkalitolerans]NYE45439.1 3-hydroxybutyryl-CoA dehydrogenase/5-formyl-3-hydroxy-2-methylpyridine 4-carboxylate dehydrogenase [Spinactinospora alkalitolerans]